MKTTSEDLFHLIHSLRKSEKRSFKLSASVDKKEKLYVTLFDLVEAQKVYDEEAIIKKLNIKKSVFAVYKNHLYHLLLQRMSNMFSGKETEVRRLLTQADFLHGKGLYSHFEKILLKAKKIASDNDSDSHLFEILNMEHQNAWRKRDMNKAEQVMNEDKKTLALFNNKRQYRHLSNAIIMELARAGDGRNPVEAKKINTLMKHPFIRNEKNALTFRSKNSLYHTLSLYYSVNNDPGRSYLYAKKAVSLYLDASEKIEHDPFNYLLTLHLMLAACHSLKKFDESKIYIDKLRLDPGVLQNELEKFWAFSTYHDSNLHFYIKTGRFNEGVPAAEEMLHEFEKYSSKIEASQTTVLYTHVAKIYFGSGNYSKCLFWLNKIFNEKYPLNARPGLESNLRLFYLIVHFEKGNYSLLQSLAKSTQNELAGKGLLYKFEMAMLDFFGKKISKKEDVLKAMIKLKQEIEIITKEERMPFEEFDYLSWIDSKIQNKSFAEIVQEKAKMK